ncbi:PH domain-containing protein [Candidatus Nanohalobium constans]|uniref:YokE-like PH domain-containing protein n=1 Tax=Candidatus Nanohalobium constans TaxID=2565781 RepID=A0A5Q0UH31_9ARCH|nr:PH domain-containing protein [Candidatus Nanohalobium constans]QGA80520.1 hypothetical protein LC1Nh_0627 [Candidatus Nanohalobium constans]
MTEFEQEPEKEHEQEFEDLDSFGQSKPEEYSGLKDRLGEDEEIRMMSTAKLKKDDKSVICLTNKRALIFNSDTAKLLGKRNKFEDIKLGQIHDIQVEERKDFDKLVITTKSGKKEIMTPEGKGVQISGLIRKQQDLQEKDPAEQLEKIGSEKEKGNITEEEYQDKKDDLMDQI